MKILIEKHCPNCGSYFTSKRNDKKYCSDTCRQMAYFKRNGLSLAGEPDPEIITEKQEAVKYIPLQPETNIEALINRLSDAWEQRLSQQIEKLRQELDIKYCQPAEEKPKQSEENAEPENYEYITSRFVRYMEMVIDIDDDWYLLKDPAYHWRPDSICVIQWVNLRLRCLLESLIRLSNYAYIDKHTLDCITDAFNHLYQSKTFRSLPANYPFKTYIEELITKVEAYCVRSKKTERVIFRISMKEKVRLIYARYILQETTPSVKFSELHFNE